MTNKELIEIRNYFYNLHDVEVNQKYDNMLPYSFHLRMVESQGKRFSHLIIDNMTNVFIGIYGHDSIEDARLTYNDIKNKFGKDVAEIIYLCTENKGRNREERKNKLFYEELNTNKEAVFVKLCDIIANSLYSLSTNFSMFQKYKKEYFEKIKPILYCEQYKEMFFFLEKIYNIDSKN